MTDAEYFSDTEYLTNSMMSWLQVGPTYFMKRINEIKNQAKQKSASYQVFGSAVHCYLLENNKFDSLFIVSSAKAPSNIVQKRFCDFVIASNSTNTDVLIRAYRMAYSTKLLKIEKIQEKAEKLFNETSEYISLSIKKGDRDILTTEQFNTIKQIDKFIKEHPELNDAMFVIGKDCKEFNEKVIQFTINGVKMKSKLDRFVIDFKKKIIKLYEVKTSSVQNEETIFKKSFKESFEKYKYGRQLILYSYAIMEFIKKNYKDVNIDDFNIEFYVLAIKSNFDNEVRLFEIPHERIEHYMVEIKNIISDYLYYKKNEFRDRKTYKEVLY